jgi:hypothetical protein
MEEEAVDNKSILNKLKQKDIQKKINNDKNVIKIESSNSNTSYISSNISDISSDLNWNTRSEEGLEFNTLRKFEAKYTLYNSNNIKY